MQLEYNVPDTERYDMIVLSSCVYPTINHVRISLQSLRTASGDEEHVKRNDVVSTP